MSVEDIRQSFETAEPARIKRAQADGSEPPYDMQLPEDCPVVPLGINEDLIFFLDALGQLRTVRDKELSKSKIMNLFGQQIGLLYRYFPRYSKPDDDGRCHVLGWAADRAAEVLTKAAADKGVWDVFERVRGPGMWVADDGKLVYHAGNVVHYKGDVLEPGHIGYHVYPAAPEKPLPADGVADTSAGEELLALLKTWNWRRPDMDPHLLLGHIGASLLGGALDWRPLIWVTGDKATGKSTLHKVVDHVFGHGGLIKSTDASAASLWQTVGHASLPVALDELESEEDNRKNMAVIKLARHAASGGQILRGGADHKSSSFTIRSCFMFSSILIPPMLGQDISRMAILQLDKLDGGPAPVLEPKKLAEIGRKLRRRIIDHYDRFESLLQTYQAMLAACGHGGRGADQFGTLLACHDLLLYDHAPSGDELADWAQRFDKAGLAESEDDIADHERCLSHLLTSLADLYRNGEKKQIGAWIQQAVRMPGDEDADKALAGVGLRVDHRRSDVTHKAYQVLQVANAHNGLARVFADTHWAGRSGTSGVWVQAMRRVEGAQASKKVVRIDGVPVRCTEIPVDKIFPEDEQAAG